MAPVSLTPTVAHFSVEVGLESAMPSYGGCLRMLAGDGLRAAADLGMPVVGVTLLHRQGYFCQPPRRDGSQVGAAGLGLGPVAKERQASHGTTRTRSRATTS
jgi:glucan phosphorylase